MPHAERVQSPEDAEAYQTEARTEAPLDHPNIVPVYDAGRTEQFLCFIVSKFLVPGPRDRDDFPDSIRLWKDRIEETDADATFAVGLLCGPSGCGKSSLVKAGLLPRLPGEVLSVYVEATAAETETRLLNGLRKRCPAPGRSTHWLSAGHGCRGKGCT